MFERVMSNPGDLHKHSLPSLGGDKFKSVLHGDLWHNNIFFLNYKEAGEENDERPPFLFADWQMCHVGNAATDLCFLLFSSTTPSTARKLL